MGQRSDTKLIKLDDEALSNQESLEEKFQDEVEIDRTSTKNESLLKTDIQDNDKSQIQLQKDTREDNEINKDEIKSTEQHFNTKSIKDQQNKLTKEKAIKVGHEEKEIGKDEREVEQTSTNETDKQADEVDEQNLKEKRVEDEQDSKINSEEGIEKAKE